jgi:hypothetical protein
LSVLLVVECPHNPPKRPPDGGEAYVLAGCNAESGPLGLRG